MASEGPNSPGTVVNDASSGDVAWVNPGNATASDNAYATVTLSYQTTQFLQATDFGFSIPAEATINGIVCEFEHKNTIGDLLLGTYIIKGGARVSASYADVQSALSEAYQSVGSPVDLWDTTWTAAEINASDFGIALFNNDPKTGVYSVDHVRITVYYTEASVPFRRSLLGVGF